MTALTKLLHRLTEPHPSITEPEARHRARLTGTLLVALFPLGLVAATVIALADSILYDVFDPIFVGLEYAIVLGILLCFLLSRTRRAALSAKFLVGILFAGIFALIIQAPQYKTSAIFLPLPLLIGGLILSRRAARLLFFATLAGTILLPALGVNWEQGDYLTILATEIVFGISILLSSGIREQYSRQVEEHRRGMEERAAYAERRADEISEALVALAALDFGKRAQTHRTDDVFDALAAGVNMLGEELQARIAELAAAKEAAETASRAKSEFLSVVSHELRSPLNAILGFAQLLEMDAASLPENSARNIRQISTAGRSLLAMINQILDFTRSDTGRLKLDPQTVDAASALRDVLDSLTDSAAQKRVTLTLEAAPASCRLRADPRRLDQILNTLIYNAIQFTPEDGKVFVKCRLVSDFGFQNSDFGSAIRNPKSAIEDSEVESSEILQITIANLGLRPEQLASLFEPFAQVDSSAARLHSGLGLELAFAQRLAELHGGSLRAESAGEGSAFLLELPV